VSNKSKANDYNVTKGSVHCHSYSLKWEPLLTCHKINFKNSIQAAVYKSYLSDMKKQSQDSEFISFLFVTYKPFPSKANPSRP